MSGTASRPRLALIGISGYGRIHLQLARDCRDRGAAELIAAVIINQEEEAMNVAELRARGCAIYSDYEEMFRRHAGQIDLCLIPTGIHWHARMSIAALRAGANVLVEKPLAGSVADAAAVQAIESSVGRFVAVGFQDCYDPGTLWLADELRGGAIGRIRSVRFLGIWPRPRSYFQRNNWAGRLQVDDVPVLDSPLNNAFGHFVMLSLLFSGAQPEEIAFRPGDVELWRAHAIESFDTAVVSLRTVHGTGLWFGASHVSRAAIEPEIIIEGTAGSARWSYEKEAWFQSAGGIRHVRPVLDQHATRRLMMAAVLRRLDDPVMKICTTGMAARHTALIAGIHGAAPIREFPRDQVEWVETSGPASAIPAVPGLESALRRAFAENGSLRASGFALAGGPNGR